MACQGRGGLTCCFCFFGLQRLSCSPAEADQSLISASSWHINFVAGLPNTTYLAANCTGRAGCVDQNLMLFYNTTKQGAADAFQGWTVMDPRKRCLPPWTKSLPACALVLQPVFCVREDV